MFAENFKKMQQQQISGQDNAQGTLSTGASESQRVWEQCRNLKKIAQEVAAAAVAAASTSAEAEAEAAEAVAIGVAFKIKSGAVCVCVCGASVRMRNALLKNYEAEHPDAGPETNPN